MYCQVCGAYNRDEDEFCNRCQQKLLVVSGTRQVEDDSFDQGQEESFSFDEHLLERISILEEVLKRTGETVRNILGALHKQEENILINHAGLATLREILEEKKVIGQDEWSELWESKMDYQLLVLEKRERFLQAKERIAAFYDGDKRKLFLQMLEEAEYALFSFNLDQAVRTLEAAFKLDRKNYELAHFLGETYFNQGDTDLALTYFAAVLEVRPEHYEGLVYSGVIHHERNEGNRAEELLKRAVALYPDAFLPHFSLGAVYAGQGNLSRAVLYLEKAIALESIPQALYLLGSCLYEMGKLAPAINYLKESVRVDPSFEEAYHLLGMAYLDRHWNRKALEAFRQAQHLNPKKMRYQDLVGFLSGHAAVPLPKVTRKAAQLLSKAEDFLESQEPRRALDLYRRALATEPENPTLLMSYALACLHMNRNHEIRALTQKVLDLNPGEMLKATAYATLIEALRIEGKYKEGNRIGLRLLDEGDSNFSKTIAYYEMAYNLAEMEESLDEALDYARRALEFSPDELKQFPLAALGWVHYKRQEFEEAIDFLSKSTELGASTTTLTHLGMALLASGQKDQARSVFARARRLTRRGGALEDKMMEFMKDSTRLMERVSRRK